MCRFKRALQGWSRGLAGVLAAALLAGCASDAPNTSYKQRILQQRMERDMTMRDRERSPMKPAVRKQFKGLNYFPVDSTYRFEVPLRPIQPPDSVRMVTNLGEMRMHAKVGTVRIPFEQDTQRLAAYHIEGEPRNQLWIPFSDSTNKARTYPAGRYLDVTLHSDSTMIVDFNRAYNPTCDYNPSYSCPLPPEENHIPFAVRAGEQRSGLHSY